VVTHRFDLPGSDGDADRVALEDQTIGRERPEQTVSTLTRPCTT
jgi:hypothetical protein